ncbi:YidC/Oxa1 family membrane protein insertase [Bulleidia sp. zg-1006]|uniref:YidC/Oxa1 family membrane protein insertase n=1 Tax=Bulleidia sp. zg-1006 TaxID=2806552 RepID=UPI001939C48F|nr:YidC/Oxa1 family membrane protein insertase [Bulleidia sp. zg-1006]QRG86740.1 membrane protein insertase YidC [Bulleidia sp. zg-1006]
MKLSTRTKKLLTLAFIVGVIVTISGCSVPHDAQGKVILITSQTTFKYVFEKESWFSAIFVWPLAWLINNLSNVVGVGGAIALVTVTLTTLLAMFTFKSQVTMQRMQMIQPELNKIQRKYEGVSSDNARMKMAQEQQALMNKYDIHPGSMMLVQFLQFPIIMAMFFAIQRAEAVANGSFLGMTFQVTPMQGLQQLMRGNLASAGYVILFLLMILSQFALIKLPLILQKKKAEAEAKKHHRRPEEVGGSSQQVMTQYLMVGMIALFGLTWASGMSYYWLVRNLVDIVKTVIVQKKIDEQKSIGGR